MTTRYGAFFVSLLLLASLFASPAAAEAVRVSAAASMTEVVNALVQAYRQQSLDDVVANFASSGALARQVAAGAPTDIYISANPKWMEHLGQQGLIARDSVRLLAHNRLVFVGTPAEPVSGLADLTRLARIGIASPKSAPVGRYAEQALASAGLYTALQRERKLIFAKDVRQALLYAERGEVDGAFVYQTDARLARRAKVGFIVPQELYPRVDYPAALTLTGAGLPAAQQFFSFLFSAEAADLLRRHGFVIPGEA